MLQDKITQAVILAAGFGTRLRPLTDNLPKAMLPIGGKPLLEWHVERLVAAGVSEIYINLFHIPQAVKDYFGDGNQYGVKITYYTEPNLRGTAGGIKNFEQYLKGDFIVCYGDVFSLIDFKRMAEAFYTKPGAIGMTVVGTTDHPEDSDLAEIAPNGEFIKVYPKPHATLPKNYKAMNAAAFIWNDRILKYIPKDTYYEIDHDLLPDILKKGEKFYGYETTEYSKDIGTPDRYQKAQEYVLKNRK